MTEGRGTGFRKIREALERNGSPPPVFETDDERSYFLTLLPAHPEVGAGKARAGDKARVDKGESHRSGAEKARADKARVDKARADPDMSRRPRHEIALRILSILQREDASQKEISRLLEHKTGSGAVRRALHALLGDHLIAYTIPGKPNSRQQKYRLVKMQLRS